MSKFKQVAELGGVQLGDVWSDQGTLKKVVHIDSNTDKPFPILCVYTNDILLSDSVVYHNEVHMVSDCELVERDGQEVEHWEPFSEDWSAYGCEGKIIKSGEYGNKGKIIKVVGVDTRWLAWVQWEACMTHTVEPCISLEFLKP